jgi:hypothetical protein
VLSFFNSFSYNGVLIFTFGCGTCLLVLSYYASRLNKMISFALILFGIAIMGMGIVAILKKHNYVDPSSVITVIPAFVALLSIPLLSLSSLKLIERNSELVKIYNNVKISVLIFTVFFVMFIILIIFAFTK